MIQDRDILSAQVDDHEQRLQSLTRSVGWLECTLRGLMMSDRQALLMQVDARERELGLERTAELRKKVKQQPERSA